jgi:uncharacterized protein (TIGR03086 family)
MPSIADRYRANAVGFTARVQGVPADAWGHQSPCADWKARDVVRHVVDTTGLFLGFIDQKLPPAPSVDEDPAGAWASARDTMQAALDDPSNLSKEFDGFFGRTTFEEAVTRFLCPDLLVHTWDLARAAKLDENLDEEEVLIVLATYEGLPADAARSPQVFGPEIKSSEGADPQSRLLNFTGRRE